MAKVLITGTAGFCMQNVVRRAINDKMPHSFASIDRINNDSNVIYYNKNHAFHIADVRDAHIIDKIFQFETPDIVIHGADESNVEDTSAIISSNILGTQIIIDNCHKYNVKKIIYVSSDKVYGQLDSETDKPFVEWISTNPRSLYGASKVSAELLVKTSGLIYNIVRLSNMYGPRQSPHRLVAKTIKSALYGNPVTIGLQVRDWTHVFDASCAILTVLNKGEPNEIYNVSANQEYTHIEIVNEICKIMEFNYNDGALSGVHPLTDFRRAMDSSKIRELGWKPSYKFKESIASVVEWYKMNQWVLK